MSDRIWWTGRVIASKRCLVWVPLGCVYVSEAKGMEMTTWHVSEIWLCQTQSWSSVLSPWTCIWGCWQEDPWRNGFPNGLYETWDVEGCLRDTDRAENLVAAVFTLECPPGLCVPSGLGTGISWWAWQWCWAQLWDHCRMEDWFVNLWHAPEDAHKQRARLWGELAIL